MCNANIYSKVLIDKFCHCYIFIFKVGSVEGGALSLSLDSLFQDVWNKTWYPKAADFVNTSKPWYIVDATDKILGRLASTIAIHIRGKDLATFTPSCDMGAFVIVVSTTPIKFSYAFFSLDICLII